MSEVKNATLEIRHRCEKGARVLILEPIHKGANIFFATGWISDQAPFDPNDVSACAQCRDSKSGRGVIE